MNVASSFLRWARALLQASAHSLLPSAVSQRGPRRLWVFLACFGVSLLVGLLWHHVGTVITGRKLGPLLFYHAFEGDAAACRRVLHAGADPNFRIENGRTVLAFAIASRKYDVAACLLDAGADPAIRNTDGSDAFQLAAFWGTPELVRRLVDRPDAKSHLVAMEEMATSGGGRAPLLRVLLAADPTAPRRKPTRNSSALLQLADTPEIAAMLLEAGADPDVVCPGPALPPQQGPPGPDMTVYEFICRWKYAHRTTGP